MSTRLDVGSVAAVLALLAGTAEHEAPRPSAPDPWPPWREWLAARNLGLVPVRDPGRFSWPGRFLGLLERDGERHGVVMFGVPPGVLHDPTGRGRGELVEAWVVAALDLELEPGPEPYGAAVDSEGRVEAIAIAPAAETSPTLVQSATALAGRGLEGDRYADGAGTFSAGSGDGRALTLIEAEVLDGVQLADGSPLTALEARRNVVTRGIELNPLVGRRFALGDVECQGRRLCEPCAHLERLTGRRLLRELVHRGGLRADILSDGTIEVGAPVRLLG